MKITALLKAADALAAAAELDAVYSGVQQHRSTLAEALEKYKAERAAHNAREKAAKPTPPPPSAEAMELAQWLANTMPGTGTALARWAVACDELMQKDKRTRREIAELWQWCRAHDFYKKVILSPLKFRQRDSAHVLWWDRLANAKQNDRPAAAIPAGQVKAGKAFRA